MDEWNNCQHEWKEVDSQNSSETRVDVICKKCDCPGEMTIATREVEWPTT